MRHSNFSRSRIDVKWIVLVWLLFSSPPVLPSEKDWIKMHFFLGESSLELSLPSRESLEFPRHPIQGAIDINDPKSYDKWLNAIPLFDKYFDFKKFLVPGTVGTLRINGMVRIFPGSVNGSDDLTTQVKSALYQRWQLSQTRGLPDAKLSDDDYVLRNINGAAWVEYQKNDTHFYVTKVDTSHYLEIYFEFTDNSRGNRTEWRKHATVDMLKVMESATLRRSH